MTQPIKRGGESTAGKAAFPPFFAIIVAGGSGLRAGGGLPKQFHDLCGSKVFLHSVMKFLEVEPTTEIIIVTHPDYVDLVKTELDKAGIRAGIVIGGKNRWESVSNGLKAIDAPKGLVAVHDAARPLVDIATIKAGWETAFKHGAGVPCVPLTDSIRKKCGEQTESVDRSQYLAVQTPQVFDLEQLRRAYGQPYKDTFTDDASVVEAAGGEVKVFEGTADNIKITTPKDFAIAELLINARI